MKKFKWRLGSGSIKMQTSGPELFLGVRAYPEPLGWQKLSRLHITVYWYSCWVDGVSGGVWPFALSDSRGG